MGGVLWHLNSLGALGVRLPPIPAASGSLRTNVFQARNLLAHDQCFERKKHSFRSFLRLKC